VVWTSDRQRVFKGHFHAIQPDLGKRKCRAESIARMSCSRCFAAFGVRVGSPVAGFNDP
jgi:hypothetical protein